MKIIQLSKEHISSAKDLFSVNKFMGVSLNDHYMGAVSNIQIANQVLLGRFVDTYLTGLNSFRAFGAYEDDDEHFSKMLGFIAMYEDVHEPTWHMTMSRNNGSRDVIQALLDHAIAYNEGNGRFKFYTLMNARHAKVIRRFSWSELNNERYDFVDEYTVPAKTRCPYYTPWEILFKRALLPVDTVVRLSFLKQKYRDAKFSGGGIVNAEDQLANLLVLEIPPDMVEEFPLEQQAEPEVQTEAEPEVQTEVQTEAEPEVQTEADPETKSELLNTGTDDATNN